MRYTTRILPAAVLGLMAISCSRIDTASATHTTSADGSSTSDVGTDSTSNGSGSTATTVSIPGPVTDTGAALPNQNSTSFGPNVKIYDPSMSPNTVQSSADAVFATQQTNQFGTPRYALFFKPGTYDANIQVGFYTTVHGLGTLPDSVLINGGVNSLAAWNTGNATDNFWRGMENLAINPTQYGGTNFWAVSQATHVRRVHVKGELTLFDWMYYAQGGVNWSSGGFIADSIADTKIESGSQQQFLTRNTTITLWDTFVWNMVFVGDNDAPSGAWPTDKYTVVPATPIVREKPYFIVDNANNYSVVVPSLNSNTVGPTWTTSQNLYASQTLPISKFYIAQAGSDTATTLNIALQRGLNLILTPGIYNLSQPIVVRNPNTIILGMGFATLSPATSAPAIIVADVDGVTVAGVILDAGTAGGPNLIQLGNANASTVSHSTNPTAVFDVSCRVGGATAGAHAQSCMVVNSQNVQLDNVWLWRADHGASANYTGWTVNPAQNGLIVNADNVVAYGLFVEHFQGYQTLWNGNGGTTYFYQSEIPYDVPDQASWTQNSENGYPSYKVSSDVTSHTAMGLGVYCNFYNDVQLDNAVETPTSNGNNIVMEHLITEWLGVKSGSAINHIINGNGNSVFNNSTNMQSVTSY